MLGLRKVNTVLLKTNFRATSVVKTHKFVKKWGTRAVSNTSVDDRIDIEFTNLVELQEKACTTFKDRDVLGTLSENKEVYNWMTYGEFGIEVQKFRNVLGGHLNFQFDDKTAIVSNNRYEWVVAMYATMSLGGQIVPMYEQSTESDWKYIIEDSDAKVIVVSSKEAYEKVKDYPGKVGKVESIVWLDAPAAHPQGYKTWLNKVSTESPFPVSHRITPEHISTLIYTSGTTGRPKGVELSHRNIQSGVYGSKASVKEEKRPRMTSLAFLPWAHIFGMTAELHACFSSGARLAIVPNRDLITHCLSLAKPTIILSVPILFNKVYDGVHKTVLTQPVFKQKIFHAAFAVARQRNTLLEHGKEVGFWLDLKHKLADKIVSSKIRNRLGGNLKFMVSGGAATSRPVIQFFEDIGIPVLEGYGLTETSPAISASSLDWSQRRIGCVGVPLPHVKLRIVDPETLEEVPIGTDGEITCHGPNVMVGYRKNESATKDAFYYYNGDKYFRSGDLGQLVDGKFLKVTGRIKEQFKLDNGKFVVPAPMEDVLMRSPFIAQVFMYGVNRPHTVALIVPDYAELNNWLNSTGNKELLSFVGCEKGVTGDVTTLPVFRHPAFQELMNSELKRVSAELKTYSRPVIWTCIAQPFSQENQMLTPKLSLRRNNILTRYQPVLDQLYTTDELSWKDDESMNACRVVYK